MGGSGLELRHAAKNATVSAQCPLDGNRFDVYGVGGGIRTLGHRNHNPALYQAELRPPYEGRFYRNKPMEGPQIPGRPAGGRAAYNPDFFHNSSTRFFTSGDISITPGQGRVKPSAGHLRVASIPIFEP